MNPLFKAAMLILFLSHCCFAKAVEPLSLEQATKQIIDQGNRVLSAHTEVVDNKEVYLIKVLTPEGHIRYIQIDAETGGVLN
jgi:uncharacterized membrane protein YkoI